MRTSVVIADDHPVVILGLKSLLQSSDAFALVGVATTGTQALELCSAIAPALAVIDVRLPEMDGLEVAAALKKSQSPTRVVLLTGSPTAALAARAHKAGAHALIGKETVSEGLLELLQDVADGSTPKARRTSSPSALTARELEVLALLATGATNKSIAEQLALSPGTVRIHVSHIFDKLGAHTRTEAVSVAAKQGLVAL